MKIISIQDALKECGENDFSRPFVIPTETVYGLAAPISNLESLKLIYELKGRPSDNPLIVHISDAEMLSGLIEGGISSDYEKLIQKFWGGPLTLVFKANQNVPMIVRGNSMNTVAVRMPQCEHLRQLIRMTGPLAAPSANISGRPSPTAIEHCVSDFGEKVSLYIDNGPCHIGVESTVLGLEGDTCVLLRAGIITPEEIEDVLGKKIKIAIEGRKGEPTMSPGQKYKHYSPSLDVYLFVGEDWREKMIEHLDARKSSKVGILSTMGSLPECKLAHNTGGNTLFYVVNDTGKDFCRKIFAGFRHLEKRCDMIFVQGNITGKYSLAIMDRLKKASSYIIK